MRTQMAAARWIRQLTLLVTLVLLLSPVSVRAQEKSAPLPPSQPAPSLVQTSVPPGFDRARVTSDSNGNPISNDPKADNCFLPPLNGLQMLATGVAEFQVPPKTQHEFDEGCSSLRAKKAIDAEVHLRKAVKQDAKFSAAWVLLGQVLESEQKMDDARDACAKPAGSSYMPAYLCLADISGRARNWDEVLKYSSLALEIDPSTAAPAYAYNAAAQFNLHNLPEAEKSALRAIDIDTSNKDPRVHFLLAQIYEAKGDRTNEAAQLREYLKFITDPHDAETVKKVLASLGG